MDTIVIFLPETAKKKSGLCEEFEINKKFLKLIYCKEEMSKASLFFFKRKIKRELRGAVIVRNKFSDRINGEKISRCGEKIAFFHLNNILKKIESDEPVGILSTNVKQIEDIKEVIMNNKRIALITNEENYDKFTNALLEQYGISGAVYKNEHIPLKYAVILPECNIMPKKVKCNIINLSNRVSGEDTILPMDIKYNPPRELKIISEIMRNADVLESVMDFFGISYNRATVSSVNLNKAIKKENE